MSALNSTALDILFVGDHAQNKVDHILIDNFLGEHTRVRFVDSYEQAEDEFSRQPPDITICEAELRGVDVRKICAELVKKACVFISSRDRDSERRKCLMKIKECYLTRPYSREQLVNAVATAYIAPQLA